MIKLTALSLILMSSSALGNGVYIGAVSTHFHEVVESESTHELLIFEHNNYIAGGFVNSFNDFTVIAGKEFTLDISEDFGAGIILGASYGYDCSYMNLCKDSFMPVMAPYISYTKYKIQPTIAIIGTAAFFTVKFNY